jgi:molybdopterin-guanine dinucleotide biosynthesis protein A
MGQNKAFIEIDGVPIITRIYSLFRQLFQEVIIVTNHADVFKSIGSKIIEDLIRDKGALGGLYTGIFYSSFQYCFSVACDMPFINKSLVGYLFENICGADAIVPQTKDGLQPLHAFYSKKCLEPIRKILEEGGYRIVDFYNMVNLRIVDEKDFLFLDPTRESFVNVNTPEELVSLTNRKKLALK